MKPGWRLLLPFLCATCFLAATLVWLKLDRLPPTWDDAWYLTNSLTMYDALVEGGVAAYFKSFWIILGFKGPLITVLPTPAYLVFGRHCWAAFAVNLAGMGILFAAMFRLGRKYGGPRAGTIALFASGAMPMLYGLSRWFLVEYVLTAMVAAAVLCLVENRLRMFGILCGFGILLKVTFPIYVAGPFVFWAIANRAALGRVRTWLDLSPAVLIAAPWYALNFRRVWQVALEAGTPTAEFYGNSGPATYFARLIREGPSVYLAVLLAGLAAVRAVRRRSPRSQGEGLAIAWVAPFLFFVFGPFQETRYAAPLLPGFALAIGLLMSSLGRGVVTALLMFPLVAMVQNSFGVFGAWRVNDARYVRRYDRRRWPNEDIVRRLGSGKLLMAADTPHFNADSLALAAREARIPVEIATTAYARDPRELSDELNRSTYFIYKDGGAERHAWVLNRLAAAAESEMRLSGDFAEVWQAPLPDGGVARVFRNVWRNSFARGGGLSAVTEDAFSRCDVTFGDQISLTGLSVRASDGMLEVKYRWKCLRSPDRDYWCFTHVLGRGDQVLGYLDHPLLDGNPPLPAWAPGDEAIERRRLRGSGIRAGRSYALRVGMFDKVSGRRLPARSTGACPVVLE